MNEEKEKLMEDLNKPMDQPLDPTPVVTADVVSPKPDKPGFNWKRSLVTIAIVLLTALVVGGTTWYIMNTNSNSINTSNNSTINAMQTNINNLKSKITSLEKPTTTTQTTQTSANQTLSLLGGKINFTIPANWEQLQGSTGNLTADAFGGCLAGAEIIPNSKPQMDGSNYNISVVVCNAGQATSAEDWFENVRNLGTPTSSDITSTTSINGLSTFYYKQTTNSYVDLSYAFLSGSYAVLVTSQVSETSYNTSGQATSTSDMTQYTPEVQDFAQSIKVSS
jgi:hypothetical protein